MPLTQVQGGMLAGSTNTTTTIQSNGTTAITIDSSQNVGIGTSSPATRLHISQALNSDTELRVQNTQAGGYATTIRMLSNGATGTSFNYLESYDATNSNQQWAIGGRGNQNTMCFSTNGNVERMRIDSSGNLAVGTATPLSARVTVAYNSGSGAGIIINQTNAAAAGNLMSFRLNNVEVGSIYQNTANTSYITSSDYRLKENIAPMTGALAKVAQLKPCTYTWKATGEAGEGFIAHELQAVVPDAVVGEKDAVNEDGSIKPQGIDTSFLVATLTAAIQELKGIVDAQAAEIAALKAK